MTEPTVKLTATQKLQNKLAALFDRISADTEAYNKGTEELNALLALANVKDGDTVRFTTGKGEAATVVTAKVLGRDDTSAKVIYGEGLGTVVVTIKLTAISEVVAEVAEPAAQEAAAE